MTVFAPKGKVRIEVEPLEWINIAQGNIKTVVAGTRHAFKVAKYARRLLAEVQYRFNRHSDLAAMVPCGGRPVL